MNRGVSFVIGAAAVVGGIFGAQKLARAGTCQMLEPMRRYYFTYVGSTTTVRDALGKAYDVIHYLEVWDPDTQEYWPPANPMTDLLLSGSRTAVMVQQPVELCGFVPMVGG